MTTTTRVIVTGLVAGGLFLTACGGNGGQGSGDDGSRALKIWTIEDVADRVEAQRRILADFTEATGVKTELVAVAEDQFNQTLTSAAAADDLPDVIGALSLAGVRDMAANELLNTDVPGQVVGSLGEGTFSDSALDLSRDGDTLLAVPSDGWAQLLYYRKDLFQHAGLPAPDSYDAIRRAARTLDQGGVAGIVAATAPGDAFTQQTFEHFALANGCQLVDDEGTITLDSPNCVESFGFYADLIRDSSVRGNQDADTTRANYFSGKSAMIVWSSFLLDELAGLRADALPTCPECKRDPQFLAKNTGVVAAFSGPSGGEPAAFGEIVSWAVTADAAEDESRRLVEYMMGDGYLPWLAISPEGKVPTRIGTEDEAEKYLTAWESLEAGVDKKAPLADVFPADVLETVRRSPDHFDRWGLRQGQGDLVGAMLGELPVPKALNELIIGGGSPAEAAKKAQADVEELAENLG